RRRLGEAPWRHARGRQGRVHVLPSRRRRVERALGAAASRRAGVVSSSLIAFVVIASGGTFIAFAQIARARAVGKRGGSIRVAARGPAQIAPYFFWVPYVLVVLRPAPELDVPDALRVIGCAPAVAGVGLALWAIRALGRHYDLVLEIHADHELVRSGPYAFVRHPVYTGLAVHFLGACLATGNALLI